MKLVGKLTLPVLSDAACDVKIRFTCITSDTSLRGLTSILAINDNGEYDVDIATGSYKLDVFDPMYLRWNLVAYVKTTEEGLSTLQKWIEEGKFTPSSETPTPELDPDWDTPIGNVCVI